METKGQIRKTLLQRRGALSTAERIKKSQMIFHTLIQEPEFVRAENILCYASYQSEVETLSFLAAVLEQNKRIFFPKVMGEGEMDFFLVNTLEQLEVGYQGILEPTVFSKQCNSFAAYYSNKNSEAFCIVVPLVGFDEKKNRLGYGKGFYDRFLQKYPSIPTIGLAFSCQQWDGLPCEERDQKLGKIITESKTYR